MLTITLTRAQTRRYESDDDEIVEGLITELHRTYGRTAAFEPAETEVLHPDGWIVSKHTRRTHL